MFNLMFSLEKPGKLDDPVVMGSLGHLIKAAHKHSKVIGLWTPSYEAALPGDEGKNLMALIDDLKNVDYLERIKIQQINWIGKSCGTEIPT